jgi:hypothetical protein
MIAVERIVEDPFKGRPKLPIATDTQISEIMTEKIENVAAYVGQSFRAKAQYGHTLITLTSDDFSKTTRLGRPQRYYKIDRQKGQETAMELMKSWGLDESKYSEQSEEYRLYGETINGEVRKYPSKLKGMYFQRTRRYYRTTGSTYEVKWSVEPNVAMFKFNPVEALAKRSKTAPLQPTQ